MKLLLTGDLHLTSRRPRNRIDDYEETVLRKLKFIYTTAAENNCDAILQPGDFFDQPDPSYSFFSQVMGIAKAFFSFAFLGTIAVMGQHDLRYRNPENSALKALEMSGHIHLANGTGNIIRIAPREIVVYGASWGDEIPKIKDPDSFNILLTHKMIIQKDPLWDGQTGYEIARPFLRKSKFDLIVSGDNHLMFWDSWGDQYIFNLGSMMRSNIAQIDHKPHVVIFDTDFPRGYIEIPIPIQPAEEVFKMEEVVKEKERNAELDAFVSGLSDHKEIGLSFQDNLREYAAANKVDHEIVKIIEEGMK